MYNSRYTEEGKAPLQATDTHNNIRVRAEQTSANTREHTHALACSTAEKLQWCCGIPGHQPQAVADTALTLQLRGRPPAPLKPPHLSTTHSFSMW